MRLLLLVFVVLFIGCTAANRDEKRSTNTQMNPPPVRGLIRKVRPIMARLFPLNNVVQISDRCSGMLVTSQHVLTSATCVSQRSTDGIKVNITDSMGSRLFYASNVRIPEQFSSARNDVERAQNNFALVTLSSRVSRARFVPLMPADDIVLNLIKKFHYASMHAAGDAMVLVTCPVLASHAAIKSGLLFTSCALPAALQGAGVMVTHPGINERLIGLMTTKLMTDWTIGVAFTDDIISLLCNWMGPIGHDEKVCTVAESNI